VADEAGDPAGPPFGIPESPRVVVDRRQRRFEGDAQVRLVLTYMFIAIFAGTIAISAFRPGRFRMLEAVKTAGDRWRNSQHVQVVSIQERGVKAIKQGADTCHRCQRH